MVSLISGKNSISYKQIGLTYCKIFFRFSLMAPYSLQNRQFMLQAQINGGSHIKELFQFQANIF
jgi:hypothetical protein